MGETQTIRLMSENVDNIVSQDLPFSSYKDSGGPPLSWYKNEDSTPIDPETQSIDFSEVPDDMTSVFLVETAFIQA